MLWTTLSLAVELWDMPVPAFALAALQPGPARRRAIAALDLTNTVLTVRSGSYTYRRFVIQMLLTDRLRDAWRLVWRGLFPEAEWLGRAMAWKHRRQSGGSACCTHCGC